MSDRHRENATRTSSAVNGVFHGIHPGMKLLALGPAAVTTAM